MIQASASKAQPRGHMMALAAVDCKWGQRERTTRVALILRADAEATVHDSKEYTAMKLVMSVLILALTITGGAAADQGKAKGKSADKKSPPTASKPTGGSQGGGGSCSPDKTPPVIHSVTSTPNVLGPPNHRMTPVAIRANVTDNCPGVSWAVTAVASDEPINGTGDGDTAPDWTIGSPHAVSVRAERAGTGDGRVYTIRITAKDGANNTATATTAVTVPHNR